MGVVKNNVYLEFAGAIKVSIAYTRGVFKLTAYPDATWGNDPKNVKSTSSHIAILISFSNARQVMIRVQDQVRESKITIHHVNARHQHVDDLGRH